MPDPLVHAQICKMGVLSRLVIPDKICKNLRISRATPLMVKQEGNRIIITKVTMDYVPPPELKAQLRDAMEHLYYRTRNGNVRLEEFLNALG